MSKEFHPLVSIVIPVYNGSNYLREAIDSALAQTYDNIEILVVNDGSTDDGETHNIAMSYGQKIRYFQKENGGVVSALNFGIENMYGEYFAWLSHDDLYLPEKIEKQVLAIKNHNTSRLAFCVCNCIFINENGEEMYRSLVQKDCAFDNPRCFLFLGNVGFNGIMVLIPTKLFDICGKFTPSLATHEYEMWIRIMDVADVVVEPECLTIMRMHSQQVSSKRKQDASVEIDNFMGNGIKNIPPEEFEAFIVDQIGKKGIEFVLGILNSYMWYQHFPHTATQTLIQLRTMCEKDSIQVDNLYSFLLGHLDVEEFKTCFTERLQSEKPRVILYCENITADVLKELSIGLALLSGRCDIILCYESSEEHYIRLLQDINVTLIPIVYNYDWFMSLRIATICYMMNAKMFWYYSGNDKMQFSQTFHYLSIMKIHSVASFRDINEFSINEQDNFNISHIDQNRNLAKASLVTSGIALSDSALLCFKKVILVPADDVQTMVRWKKIFDVLLTTDGVCELEHRIINELSAIIEKGHGSSAEYIHDFIRDFLFEVDRKEVELINSYEQRTFWKLTKPLRSCVWFLRKADSAVRRIIKHKTPLRSIVYHTRLILKNRRLSA